MGGFVTYDLIFVSARVVAVEVAEKFIELDSYLGLELCRLCIFFPMACSFFSTFRFFFLHEL